MNVKTLKNEVQLKLELNAMAQPAVDAADEAKAAAGNANNAAARVEAAIAQSNTAIQNANAAASSANTATNEAWTAAQSAQKSATAADQAAANAHTEALLASAGAANANTAAQSAYASGTEAVSIANAAAQDAVSISTTAANAANEAAERANAARELLQGDLSVVLDPKANVIMDNSPKAANHEIHAQDGRLAVTLYGKTTETGTGDKSPDNPYVISGVDAARVQAGGKNLFDPGVSVSDYFSEKGVKPYAVNEDGTLTLTIQAGGQSFFFRDVMLPIAPPVTFSTHVKANVAADARFIVRILDKDKNILTTGCSGTYNTYYLGFWQKTSTTGAFDGNFTITNKNAAYVVFGIGFSSNSSVADWTTLTVSEMFAAYGADVPYEPYTANVITPALLPDGAPLHGNGTVDDTVENDVPSGCDKKIVLDGTEGYSSYGNGCWTTGIIPDYVSGTPVYSNWIKSGTGDDVYSGKEAISATGTNNGSILIKIDGLNTAEMNTALTNRPLTVYYRSTDYTPEKDLRVCRVVRNWKTVTLDGTQTMNRVANYGDVTRFDIPSLGIKSGTVVKSERFNPITAGAQNTEGMAAHGSNDTLILQIKTSRLSTDDAAGLKAYFEANPEVITYQARTEATYMTDPLPLRKPDGIMPVTVTGSAETAVAYPCDTKSYIDRKFDALAAALLS